MLAQPSVAQRGQKAQGNLKHTEDTSHLLGHQLLALFSF